MYRSVWSADKNLIMRHFERDSFVYSIITVTVKPLLQKPRENASTGH